MKNRLITLIDFSIYSHALAELAVRWGRIASAQLVFVHEVPGLVPSMADTSSKDEIVKNEKEEALEKLRRFTSTETYEIDVRFVVTGSHLLTTINELLSEGFNDTILVGIKGTGMLKQMLIGNTASMVIDEINRTVVAVPDKLCAVPNEFCNLVPKRLVVSLNYKFPLNEEALNDFLNQYNNAIQEIEFISSVDNDEKEDKAKDYLNKLSDKYSMNLKSSYRVFIGKKHFEQIKNYVQSSPNTVLIVQKGSRNLTDLLFRKFLINEVIHDGSLPMVVLPTVLN